MPKVKTNRFKKAEFKKAVNKRMFDRMSETGRRISVREFAEDIGVSPATFSRVSRGGEPDLQSFFQFCFWMKRSANEFYMH